MFVLKDSMRLRGSNCHSPQSFGHFFSLPPLLWTQIFFPPIVQVFFSFKNSSISNRNILFFLKANRAATVYSIDTFTVLFVLVFSFSEGCMCATVFTNGNCIIFSPIVICCEHASTTNGLFSSFIPPLYIPIVGKQQGKQSNRKGMEKSAFF